MSATETEPTILLADDDADIRELLRTLLEGRGCRIIEASNGAAALEKILEEEPDLVVLDVMMPEVNGWEVARYIRQKEHLADTRILMLTGVGRTVNELTSPLFGADDHLDKPFQLDEVDARIRSLLARNGLSIRPFDP